MFLTFVFGIIQFELFSDELFSHSALKFSQKVRKLPTEKIMKILKYKVFINTGSFCVDIHNVEIKINFVKLYLIQFTFTVEMYKIRFAV